LLLPLLLNHESHTKYQISNIAFAFAFKLHITYYILHIIFLRVSVLNEFLYISVVMTSIYSMARKIGWCQGLQLPPLK